jgi:15-cis-phytoene synthase
MNDDLQFAYSQARDLVRANDPDRYIATLFAPENQRPHLYALYAFNLEIARIRNVISQPLPGEVRLQWWRDVIEAGEPNSGHPIAAVLLDTITQNKLPHQAFTDMLDARIFDLYDDIMPTWRDIDGYCGETCSALFRLATLILSRGEENGTAEISGHAGIAYALTDILRSLPVHIKRGQIYFPQEALDDHNLRAEDMLAGILIPSINRLLSQTRSKVWDHLAQAHGAARFLDPALHSVFLPLASIKPYFKQMTKKDYQPIETKIELANWQRIWAMWRFKL